MNSKNFLGVLQADIKIYKTNENEYSLEIINEKNDKIEKETSTFVFLFIFLKRLRTDLVLAEAVIHECIQQIC